MHSASRIGYARRDLWAWIHTLVSATRSVANFKCGTIQILPTILLFYHRFWDWSATLKVRVSSKSWQTCANASVISSFTVGIFSTITRIYAFFISACKSGWAFRICQAFIWFTFNVGTAFVPFRTLTSSTVSVHSTESFDSALFKWTRILTFSLDACLSQWTFIVTFTTS